MKTLKTILTGALVAFSLNSATAAYDPAVNAPQAASADTSYLFVLAAKEAKTKHTRNGVTLLSLHQSEIDQVIMFSDRPNRIVKAITDDQLNQLWKEGDNSFEQDPPNAVLSADGVLPQIVTIVGLKADHNDVVYRIKSTKPTHQLILPKRLRHMVLTIDNDNCIADPANPNGNVGHTANGNICILSTGGANDYLSY